ncbi:general substrate transporter [Gautieria morchelliformis]|nr:general substrate transporter [Gautieria morchelliformis]
MGKAFNIFAAFFAAIGSFLFGYDSGIISSILTYSTFNAHFHNPSKALTGAVVSTFTGGCFFGALGAGWGSDRFGRKRTIQAGCVWALWGCAMQAGAPNIACLLIGRIVAGVAIGILSMVVPLYNTEIAPPKIRGFVVGLAQQMIGFGFIAANWVGYGCQFFKDDKQWRLPLGLQIVPAFLLLVGIHFLPYSPRWLLEQGRDEEAHAVVRYLHSSSWETDASGTPASELAEREFAEMRDMIHAEKHVRSRRISDLWSTPAMLKRTLVACGVQMMGQFTGINVINYFGPQMYAALGLASNQVLLVQGIYGALGPIANLFFIIFALDTVGRKRPLMFGAGSLVVLFSILSAIVASFPPGVGTPNIAAQRAGIAMIFLMSVTFSVSFGPISWVLASEVFPTRTRAIGTSAATCANWLMNVLISEASPVAMQNSSWKYYILFIVLNIADFFIIAFLFPETKGKSLEEMATVFGDDVDVGEVLDQHGDHVTEVKASAAPPQQIDEKGT